MPALFTVLLLLVAGCGGSESNPDDELRDWVSRGELAAEEKNRGELLDMISLNYVDARGNDREQIGGVLRVYFLRQSSIALLTSIEEISVSGDTAAKILLSVGMAGMKNNAFGFDADAYKFEFELVKPDDDWLLIGARWGEFGSELR